MLALAGTHSNLLGIKGLKIDIFFNIWFFSYGERRALQPVINILFVKWPSNSGMSDLQWYPSNFGLIKKEQLKFKKFYE